MTDTSKTRIFYNSQIPVRLTKLLKDVIPDGFELVTLESDDDAERVEKIRNAEVAVVAAKPLKEEVLAAASNLRLIHHQGVGYQDTLPLSAIKNQGIRLAITPVGTTESVAEHTIMLMLAALRHLPFADNQLRQGEWLINELRLDSRELRFCKVGIIGMGRIGQAVAKLLKAFGTCGYYYDPHVSLPEEVEQELGFSKRDFDEVIKSAQILTLHVPRNGETRHCINEHSIGLLPDRAVIINAARGGLVDEQALTSALKTGKLGAAALDVFENEPPTLSNELLKLNNVVVTPHIAAGTRDAIMEKWQFIYKNITSFTSCGMLEHEVSL